MLSNGTHSYIKDNRNENIKIYINGDFYNRKDAKISVFDSGFLLGDGVWEGIRLLNGNLVFIEEHLDRLFASAQGISLDIPLSRQNILDELNKVLIKNNMNDNIHIRLIVSRGDKITPYQNPNANVGPINFVIIPEYKKTNPETYIKGLTIGRVDNVRPNENILSPHYNTLSKLNCILASIEANKHGYDEGIMNDINGNVSTCNSTNLFFIQDNTVITSTGEYCLNGITRAKAIQLCHENNIQCNEINFTFEDIRNCDEAFVTGTFAGIIPVSKLEDKELKSTQSSSIVNKIRELYNQKIKEYIG